MSRSSIALANLRAVVIVIVLAFHAVLPYLVSLPAEPYRFNAEPYRWQAFPVIDSERWFGFDLFCAWQDLSLMALMFFLSGLFVMASLSRKGAWGFLSDRLVRIGIPLALVVLILMPVAYYPAYRATAVDPSVAAYWRHWLALPFWPPGPQWFLYQLLLLNAIAAALYRFSPGALSALNRAVAPLCESPVRFFWALVAVSAAAYVPLAMATSPFTWSNIGPVSFQHSRPLLYTVYFFAGVAAGAYGIERGFLACDGPLGRRWQSWLAAAVAGFVLWALPTSAAMDDWPNAPLFVKAASGVGFAIACAAGALFLVAVCLRFARQRHRTFDVLSENAYGLYLVHYVFAVWLQFALLGLPLFAVGKATIVLAGTMALSLVAVLSFNVLWRGAQPVESGARRAPSMAAGPRRID